MTFFSELKHNLIGELVLVADNDGLLRSSYLDAKNAPIMQQDWVHDSNHSILAQAICQLNEYLRGDRRNFSVPLQPRGTPFQLKVWNEIQNIPIGSTISYTDLAAKLRMPRAARSIASAIAQNPLLIFIPDHRVVNQDGTFGGFAGSWSRKPGLLELEGRPAKKGGAP